MSAMPSAPPLRHNPLDAVEPKGVFIVETGAKGKDGARSHAQVLRVRAQALIGELREIISRT